MRSHARPCGGDARPCEAMRSHARPCEAMRGHARGCEAMRGNARRCEAMRCHAKQCEAMRCYAGPYEAMGSHAKPCEAIRSHGKPCKPCEAMRGHAGPGGAMVGGARRHVGPCYAVPARLLNRLTVPGFAAAAACTCRQHGNPAIRCCLVGLRAATMTAIFQDNFCHGLA